jgi:prophage regulatory protein
MTAKKEAAHHARVMHPAQRSPFGDGAVSAPKSPTDQEAKAPYQARGPPEAARQIIRWPEVHHRTGRSRTSAWRDVRKGTFPAPVEIGNNAIGWYEHEIQAWIASRPRAAYAA